MQVPWKEMKQAKGEGAMVTLGLIGSEAEVEDAQEAIEGLLEEIGAFGEMMVAAGQVQGIIGKVSPGSITHCELSCEAENRNKLLN